MVVKSFPLPDKRTHINVYASILVYRVDLRVSFAFSRSPLAVHQAPAETKCCAAVVP